MFLSCSSSFDTSTLSHPSRTFICLVSRKGYVFPSLDTAFPPPPRFPLPWEATGPTGYPALGLSHQRNSEAKRPGEEETLLTHPTLSNWYWLAGFGVFFPWSPGYKQLRTESGDSKSLEREKTAVRREANTLPQSRLGHSGMVMPPLKPMPSFTEYFLWARPFIYSSSLDHHNPMR